MMPLARCFTLACALTLPLAAVATPAVALPLASRAAPLAASGAPDALDGFKRHIGHIVVIVQENWGFDALYGHFPGANGYANALSFAQLDPSGNVAQTLGPVLNGGQPDARFPATLPVAPFDLAQFVTTSAMTGDPNHNFYIQQAEIDGGKMDRYLSFPTSAQGGLPFGYFDATNLPEGKLAQQYVLADNFHQSSFGGSFINNMWTACACTPKIPNPPANLLEQVDANGNPTQIGGPEGRLTPDGYVVNTSYSAQYPQITPNRAFLYVPPLDDPTLGDRLTAAHVPWTYYAGGYDDAIAGKPDPTFQAHHQSYLFFKNYAPGAPGTAHLKDDKQFFADLAAGTLPAVSWVKPLGADNEHPGYANLMRGQMYVANLIGQLQMSPTWKDTLAIIVYDEAGGHYDHVAPMAVDRWGPSTRVPAIFISPFAKRGVVDHTNYETVSILRTIELRFGLQPLTSRDAAATPILSPFDFTQPVPAAYDRHALGDLPPLPPAPLPPHYHGAPVTEVEIDE